MMQQTLKTPETIVYRKVRDEIVLIHLDNGQIYYFTPGAKDFLDFFKQPRRLASYVEHVGMDQSAQSSVEEIKNFANFLVENQILKTDETPVELRLAETKAYSPLQFLRKDERMLDEIAFLCP